ncbi:MAG: integrase arm-type DNA-binding domain-containing protein [Pseudomonadaceae bacterium]|nr:integrase arm-type DNA-binding domain-containing protein [Pseudomonadaceae bacterium]
MARQINRLSDQTIKAKGLAPGMYADGASLYLQVTKQGGKSWIFRYRSRAKGGKLADMGLGAYPEVTLANARDKAADQRELIRDGRDPLLERNERKALLAQRAKEAKIASQRQIAFTDAAERYITAHEPSWKNAKHADQWRNTLATYAYARLGSKEVSSIETADIVKTLEPIWYTKTETASRVRGRIEAVLDWATALGHRTGDNPARWRNHLSNILPKPQNVRQTEHHPAVPTERIYAVVQELRRQSTQGAKALEFLILTATRLGETQGARWAEFEGDTWVIPAERMKSQREHRVPLTRRALRILELQPRLGDFVFPGTRYDRPISDGSIRAALRKAGERNATVHGFRSSFRDWVSERTNTPNETAELALAHTIRDKTEAAYRRGDQLEKRRVLMRKWAKFVEQEPLEGAVLDFRQAR